MLNPKLTKSQKDQLKEVLREAALLSTMTKEPDAKKDKIIFEFTNHLVAKLCN